MFENRKLGILNLKISDEDQQIPSGQLVQRVRLYRSCRFRQPFVARGQRLKRRIAAATFFSSLCAKNTPGGVSFIRPYRVHLIAPYLECGKFLWMTRSDRIQFFELSFQFIINVSSGAQQASSWNFASVIGSWKLLLTHFAWSRSPIKRPNRSRTSWRPQSQKSGFDWSRISVDFVQNLPHSSVAGPKTEI